MYSISSVVIAVALFLLILLANEISYRIGRRAAATADEGISTQTNAIQAGILGLLALLLGFSFNMALQRYDARSAAVIEEANAIGTAWLRTALLSEDDARVVGGLLSDYVDLRLKASKVDMASTAERDEVIKATQQLQTTLWHVVTESSIADLPPARVSLLVQSLNQVFDAYGSRQAQLDKHVPEVVLMLLFVIFIISGSILGVAAGLAGGRPFTATVSLAALIVLVIFIVIDLDRPRRGLIQVDQSSMAALRPLIDEGLAR